MIHLRDVRKVYPTRFGENVVLDGVNFDLAMGEKLGVLGRNGAGKSTMVRLISGAELPTSGTIERNMSVSWPIAFGGAFQPTLTGVDNVRFISRIYDQDFEKNLAFVEEFAELGPYLREEVRTYSSGMRARLAFAISMIIEFDCFLIDEVGAVGDARFHERCNRELFQNRGDRAMVIISHDAGYVRDHCNRFAILHNSKLIMYEDFDEAYSDFREYIGLEAASRAAPKDLPQSRRELIETTHTAAVHDDAFRVLVQDADWKRDAGNWLEAEMTYAEALRLYPYQRSYWAQLANCAKDAGAFDRAEAAYRTSCALGEPLTDLRDFIDFVMAKQGVSAEEFPIATYVGGPAFEQAPALPDIDLLSRMAWKVDQVADDEKLHMLRTHPTCDDMLADLIADPRFEAAQKRWLQSARERGTDKFDDGTKASQSSKDVQSWVYNLVCIACSARLGHDPAAIARKIKGKDNAWAVIIAAGGFSDWPKSRAAIAAKVGS